MKPTIYILIVLLCSLVYPTYCQRFSIGLTGGVNAAQLDGDDYTGYDKLGKRFGIRSEAKVSPLGDVVIELLYSEKGSRFQLENGVATDKSKRRIIHLNYAEVPILFRGFFRKRYHSFYEVGVSLAYLIKDRYEVRTEEGVGLEDFKELSPHFRRNEWNGVFGFGYQFNRSIGLFFRATIALQKVYQRPFEEGDRTEEYIFWEGSKEAVNEIDRLRNYYISAGAFYML